MPDRHKHNPLTFRPEGQRTLGSAMTCEICGVPVVRTSSQQKYCATCAQERQREFDKAYQQRRHADGRALEDARRWRAAHAEEIKQARQEWADRNPQRTLLNRARNRAKVTGVPFNIEAEDIFVPSACPILGIPLKRNRGLSPGPDSPTLDRINPARGYVKGNVQVISHRANTMKHNATLAELVKLGTWAAQQLEREAR